MLSELQGMSVVVSPLLDLMGQPKLQVSPDCPMTDAGRARMNSWLLSMFGRSEHCAMRQGNTIFVSQATFKLLKTHGHLEGVTVQ